MTTRIFGAGRRLIRSVSGGNFTSASDPTVNSDSTAGYRVGDFWFNSATLNVFVCASAAVGAAVWRHQPRQWSSVGAATTLTGTTSETVFATLAMPAGVMGVNGLIAVATSWEATNNANVKNGRLRLGASGAGTGGTSMRTAAMASGAAWMELFQFKNNNASNVQQAFNTSSGTFGVGSGGSAAVTAAIDTSAAFELAFTGQLTNSGDSLILKAWSVTLTRPDIGA